jgi:hypothetical protein
MRYQLAWHSAWLYTLLLVGFIPYLLAALLVRKKMTVEIGVCRKHLRRHYAGIGGAWLGVLVTIGTCTAEFSEHPPLVVGIAFIAIAVFLVLGVLVGQLVQPARIETGRAWIKCGHAFTKSLAQRH